MLICFTPTFADPLTFTNNFRSSSQNLFKVKLDLHWPVGCELTIALRIRCGRPLEVTCCSDIIEQNHRQGCNPDILGTDEGVAVAVGYVTRFGSPK